MRYFESNNSIPPLSVKEMTIKRKCFYYLSVKTKELILYNIIFDLMGVSKKEILSKNRKSRLMKARYIFVELARIMGLGRSETSHIMGKDHSTIYNRLKRFHDLIEHDRSPFGDELRKTFNDCFFELENVIDNEIERKEFKDSERLKRSKTSPWVAPGLGSI